MARATTPLLGLFKLLQGEQFGHVTFNEVVNRLDFLLNTPMIEDIQDSPPDAQQNGQIWIVEPGAYGEWSGKDNHLAAYYGARKIGEQRDGGKWYFQAPWIGLRVYWPTAAPSAKFLKWDGSAWVDW